MSTMRYWRLAILLGALAVAAGSATAQPVVGACRFDVAALSFAGTPSEQAQCLLRPIAIGGVPGPWLPQLPPALGRLLGQQGVEVTRETLRRYLGGQGLQEARLGGSLASPVSRARGGAPQAPAARYFVIHDTSAPYLRDQPFPADLDTLPAINGLDRYRSASNEAVAHVFVSRRGETMVGHDFSVPWRATRLESQVVGLPSKGLFLHIELVQPSRRDPSNSNSNNDRFAPDPGFARAQYEMLALLYVMASVRAGQWLVPAFHAALDEGIQGGHDDPQNFQLTLLDEAIGRLLTTLR